MTGPNRASLAKGEVVIERSFPVDRTDLVRYAGAGGDFNPLHWDEATATSAGLPNVIAHGMFTMALGSCAVADWLG
ncbi:MAG: dehydratase, partial [Micrococcales bacterium]